MRELVHSLLERAREQVEVSIVTLLDGQVPPIFQDFFLSTVKVSPLDFQKELWRGSSGAQLKHSLKEIICVSSNYCTYSLCCICLLNIR